MLFLAYCTVFSFTKKNWIQDLNPTMQAEANGYIRDISDKLYRSAQRTGMDTKHLDYEMQIFLQNAGFQSPIS